ncbi:Ca2+/Na+ antiporter [Plesiocystis pacifica SIR-1]|uniref:Ca2+/Na+ antiporter n=1 Tax=Plesiocystis pacifica SIR-1 TaxID=391625 RepID=A6GGZ5_9BACT|nr:calcium/sodium antiporter [Plesiocystis pacifica]EDM74880.1 Ca2+/Na+ antiporter [Plesiocystis pacifica SIR-1]
MSLGLAIVTVLVAFYAMSAVVEGPFMASLDRIAERMGLSSSVAGATLLAFGTSAPELSTALVALFAEGAHASTGVGSIVGSAIFQILVVVGFAAVVRASTLDWRPVIRDALFYALSIVLLIAFVHDDRLTLVEAAILVGSYGLYLGVMWIWTRRVDEPEPEPELEPEPEVDPEAPEPGPFARLRRALTWPIDRLLALVPDPASQARWTLPVFALSLGLIGFSCYWLVFAAEAIAQALAVPPAIIALTILAGGSSIPELVSSATVARQGRADMAVANAVGSNIFDILVSLGLPVLLYCLLHGDLVGLGGATITSSLVLLGATLAMVVGLLAAQRFRASRAFGALLISAYAAYVVAAYLGWIT